MTALLRTGLRALPILCLLSGLAVAQTPAPKPVPPAPARPTTGAEKPVPNPPPVAGKPEPGAPDERRDPTQASSKLAEALMKKNLPGGGPLPKAPLIALKGRVISKDQPPAALVEIDGKLYSVGKDSVIVTGNSLILKVIEVGVIEVRIQVSPLNEMIVLR